MSRLWGELYSKILLNLTLSYLMPCLAFQMVAVSRDHFLATMLVVSGRSGCFSVYPSSACAEKLESPGLRQVSMFLYVGVVGVYGAQWRMEDNLRCWPWALFHLWCKV